MHKPGLNTAQERKNMSRPYHIVAGDSYVYSLRIRLGLGVEDLSPSALA